MPVQFLLMLVWCIGNCDKEISLVFEYQNYLDLLKELIPDPLHNSGCYIALSTVLKAYYRLPTIVLYTKRETGKENVTDNIICPFVFDQFHASPNGYFESVPAKEQHLIESSEWFCRLPGSYVCDKNSDCQMDECGCTYKDVDVFLCADRSGCVTFNKVCDGIRTCSDASDEFLCEQFYEMSCPTISPYPVFISDLDYCSNEDYYTSHCCGVHSNVNCSALLISHRENYYANPIDECLYQARQSRLIDIYSHSFELIPLFCARNCSNATKFFDENWTKFCGAVYSGVTSNLLSLDFVFQCDGKPFGEKAYHISVICDEKIDCINGNDEIGCPGRFYCFPNSSKEWVVESKVCDYTKDCSNGWDECQEQCFDSVFSSSKLLIRSSTIFILTICSGLSMIILNCMVGCRCYMSTPTTNTAKVDRIMCLQVFFFDFLMGIYNCAIVICSVVLSQKGDYCMMDREWRSSYFCPVLGILFSVASHGSLMAIAFISIIRCLVCTRTITHIRQSRVIMISGIILAINFIHAIVPVIPVATIQNIFRSDLFLVNFKSNPFVSSNRVNRSQFDEIHLKYFKKKANFFRTMENLNMITTKGNIFDFVEIGYYGNTAMCIHNIFKINDSYFKYKLSYLLSLVLLLMVFALTYINILHSKISSRRKVSNTRNGSNTRGPSMGAKIILMIGTEITSWILFISATIFYQVNDKPPEPVIFEMFALVVIPLNSLLNPLFYSEIYSKVATVIQQSKVVRSLRRQTNKVTKKDSEGLESEISGMHHRYSVKNLPDHVKHLPDTNRIVVAEIHQSLQKDTPSKNQTFKICDIVIAGDNSKGIDKQTCCSVPEKCSFRRRGKSIDNFEVFFPSESQSDNSSFSQDTLKRNRTI